MRNLLILPILLLSMNAGAAFAEEVPHLRAFLRNIEWSMRFVTEELRAASSCNNVEFVSGSAAPYNAIGATDRYFSSVAIPAAQNWGNDVCEIRFTVHDPNPPTIPEIKDKSESYTLPVPSLVKGKKILLVKIANMVGVNPKWLCKTDIDLGLDNMFQGASSVITANDPSIIAHFSDNSFTGNCIYVASPW